MTGFALSAFAAVLLGLLLVVVGFVPYVAWSYRRRGVFGPGHAVIAAGAAVYGLALWTYTVLPLPTPDEVCRVELEPQLRPFQFLADLQAPGTTQLVIAQVLLNVVLFVPLGMFVRHLFGRGLATTVLVGFGTSLLIELTQLTGDWWLYPCAYRVFDVDDLLANTTGAAIGFALAPLLRLVPGQPRVDLGDPRPVTAGRRLLGMAADYLMVAITQLAVWVAVGTTLKQTGAMTSAELAEGGLPVFAVELTVAACYLLAVPLLSGGATLGQRLVLIRPQTEAGTRPATGRVLRRVAAGSGGYFLLSAVDTLVESSALSLATFAWAGVSILLAWRGDHRGLSGIAAGLRVVDARAVWRASTPAERWAAAPELRKLSTAVIVLAAVLHVGLLVLLDLAGAASAATAVLAISIAAAMVISSIALVGFLIANGLTMLRKEGRRLGNLLSLLLGLGLCGLAALTVVAVLSGGRLLAIAVGIAWVLTAYFGFVFWAFLLYGVLYARRTPRAGADSIVVLGSRVFGTRVPPLLASRLDRGREVLDAEPGAVLVCSGGQGPGEDLPEGEAMARYLESAGVAPERLRRETESANTEQNLLLSLELLRAEGRGERLIVVTNDFHAFRAAIITRELGMAAQVVGSPTARYYFPTAVLREFVGVLRRQVVVHALVVAFVLAVGAAIALR